MASVANLQPEPAPILACTISRDVQNFELLIDDMELEMGESWGDLTFEDAQDFLSQSDAQGLIFVAVAVMETALMSTCTSACSAKTRFCFFGWAAYSSWKSSEQSIISPSASALAASCFWLGGVGGTASASASASASAMS
jgi:hypothetical protein